MTTAEKIKLALTPAPKEGSISNLQFQKDLGEFSSAVKGLEAETYVYDALHADGGLTGAFTTFIDHLFQPAFFTAIGAYFAKRAGRKVHLIIEDGQQKIEITSGNVDEIMDILETIKKKK